MNTESEDRGLLRELHRLPSSLPPRRDLWPEIEARLGGRSAPVRHRGRRWPLAVASVAAAFLVGLLLGRETAAPAAPGELADAPKVAELSLAAALEGAEREYEAALMSLTPVGAAPPGLADETVQDIERSWRDLRQAETALLTALDDFPNNRYLNQKLIDLRSQQLAFLRELYLLDRDNRRTT